MHRPAIKEPVHLPLGPGQSTLLRGDIGAEESGRQASMLDAPNSPGTPYNEPPESSTECQCVQEKGLPKQLEGQEQPQRSATINVVEEVAQQPSAETPTPSSINRRRKLGQNPQFEATEDNGTHTGDTGERRPKRQRTQSLSESEASQEPEIDTEDSAVTSVHHWAQEGRWPKEYFTESVDMSQLARKRSSTSLTTRPTENPSSSSGKGTPVRNLLYEKTLLASGIYMDMDLEMVPTDSCLDLCRNLLDTEQPTPTVSLFGDEILSYTCNRLRRRNEAMIVRDILPLIVPPAEVLYSLGAKHLKHLTEEVNAAWYKSPPLIKGPHPQPDYFVGLAASAFSSRQLEKLDPFVRDLQPSAFMPTEWMHFPFLTCEVKCGNEALEVADRQNAHSASVAVKAVVELYRAVSREKELHRKILAFSVSHNQERGKIYGHFPVFNGDKVTFHRHLIQDVNFVSSNGRDRWTGYKFTRNVYDIFVPIHLERVCSAIDQLPDPGGPGMFDVEPLPQRWTADLMERDDSQSTPLHSEGTPSRAPLSQTTEPAFKKPRKPGTLPSHE